MSDRRHPELALHKAVVAYLRVACPQPPEGPLWWHTHNEGKRSKADAATAKAMGQWRGLPDLLLLWRGRLHGIELKAGRGKLSPAQDRCHEALTLAGAVVTTCRSVEEVDGFLRACGVPMREVRIV